MTLMPHAKTFAATTALLSSLAVAPVFAPAYAQDSGFRDCLRNVVTDRLEH